MLNCSFWLFKNHCSFFLFLSILNRKLLFFTKLCQTEICWSDEGVIACLRKIIKPDLYLHRVVIFTKFLFRYFETPPRWIYVFVNHLAFVEEKFIRLPFPEDSEESRSSPEEPPPRKRWKVLRSNFCIQCSSFPFFNFFTPNNQLTSFLLSVIFDWLDEAIGRRSEDLSHSGFQCSNQFSRLGIMVHFKD